MSSQANKFTFSDVNSHLSRKELLILLNKIKPKTLIIKHFDSEIDLDRINNDVELDIEI